MRQPKTWIIVTNAETARLFEFTGPAQPLLPLHDHVWHAPEIAGYDDAQGVSHSSVGHSQHRLAEHNGPDRQSDAFASLIATNLAQAENSDAFERLILIAAPRMLGMLREKLGSAVHEKIWIEIAKDLTHLPLEKLDAALRTQMNT